MDSYNKVNSQNIQKAIKIVEEEGIENFTSSLCASDLFILPKKKGLFSKRKKDVTFVLTEECANQIINRSKMNKYLKLIKGEKYPVTFDDDKKFAYEIENAVNEINYIYNSKTDDENFDKVVADLNNIFSKTITFDKKEKVVNVKFADSKEDLKTIFTPISEYYNKAKENVKKQQQEDGYSL